MRIFSAIAAAAVLALPAQAQRRVFRAPSAPVRVAPAAGLTQHQLHSLFETGGYKLPRSVRSAATSPSGRGQAGNGAAPAAAPSFAEKAATLFGYAPVVSKKAPRAFGIPSDGEMDGEVRRSPRDNAERERLVQELFIQAGARPEEIRKQDIGRGRNNFIVVKKGRTDRVIVVGAHHDKVSAGQGVIDNWTGATMVANLYQQLRDVETEHTLVFIAFGREEEGLIGSAHYVRSLPKDQLAKIDSMVNLDTLAVDGTYTWKNKSDEELLRQFRETAARTQLGLVERSFWGGDADSTSFRRAGVKAITVFGASPEIIFDIIHSETDDTGAFRLEHYVNAYRLCAAVLKDLDRRSSSSQPSSF